MVPPTVEKVYRGEHGAAVMWVSPTKSFKDLGAKGAPAAPAPLQAAWDRQIVKAKMFHNLINDIDPNLGNWLVDPAWNLILIDFSRCFTPGRDMAHTLTRVDADLWDRMKALTEASLTDGDRQADRHGRAQGHPSAARPPAADHRQARQGTRGGLRLHARRLKRTADVGRAFRPGASGGLKPAGYVRPRSALGPPAVDLHFLVAGRDDEQIGRQRRGRHADELGRHARARARNRRRSQRHESGAERG